MHRTDPSSERKLCTLRICDPGWLVVNTIHTLIGTLVYVHRSAAIDDTDDIYRRVRDFVRDRGLSLLFQELGPKGDLTMIFHQGETLLYGERGVTADEAWDEMNTN